MKDWDRRACAHAWRAILRAVLPQQLRELGDVGRDPPRA